jgi:hypothetical protein
MMHVVRFALLLSAAHPSFLLVAAQNDGDYPSCIGLALASDFSYEGDVTDSASCQEACSVLFQDDGTYVTVTTTTAAEDDDGTILAYCECSGQGGRLCQDEVSSGGNETTTTTTALPEEGTTMAETTVSSSTPSVVVPGGEASTSAPSPPPPSYTATATSNAAVTLAGVSVILVLSLLAMTAATQPLT